MKKVNKKEMSTTEVADMLKISRIAVFKRIRSGQLRARKVGRNYIVNLEDINTSGNPLHAGELTDQGKKAIEDSVDKTINEYGETLDLLGKEDRRK